MNLMQWEQEILQMKRRRLRSMARTKDSKLATSAVWNNNYWLRPPIEPDKIFVHHMVAVNWTGVRCGEYFKHAGVSSNYGIGYKGDICQYVEEKHGAYCQGSKYWNRRGISMELANNSSKGWTVSDETLNACINLVADIAIRRHFGHINYTGDTRGNLCMHKWVANTGCPGPYLDKKFELIETEANKIIDGKLRLHVRGYFKEGDRGRDVRILQRFLRSQGYYKGPYKGAVGRYLSGTKRAVKKFQKAHHLTVDGLFGEECMKAAGRILKG